MERRNALKLFGILFVCLAEGGPVMAETTTTTTGAIKVPEWTRSYQFHEEGIEQIIIIRKNGKKIIVPFSDICDALET